MNVIRNIARIFKHSNPDLAAQMEKEAERFEQMNENERAARLEELKRLAGR